MSKLNSFVQKARGEVSRTEIAPVVNLTPTGTTKVVARTDVKPSVLSAADMAELDRLRAENAALKARASKTKPITMKVSEKGGLSIYGLGRFPFTFYREQIETILGMADQIRAFIAANDARLSRKGE